MPRIERTSRAKTDAVEIWAYIVDDNVTAADDLIDQFESRLASLAGMPESAEAVPYIAPDVRRSSVGNYVIYDRPIDDGIQVLRILHGARQPEDVVQALSMVTLSSRIITQNETIRVWAISSSCQWPPLPRPSPPQLSESNSLTDLFTGT